MKEKGPDGRIRTFVCEKKRRGEEKRGGEGGLLLVEGRFMLGFLCECTFSEGGWGGAECATRSGEWLVTWNVRTGTSKVLR
jgi:hypothetical protein